MGIALGAQTHFSQGWDTSLLGAATAIGVETIRDSLPWAAIETAAGTYDFSVPQAAWLDQALGRGVTVTLTFAHTNALYDKGYTVYTDAGREAFADFIVATLRHYPNVAAIEIGNEYNSNSYVTGPVAASSAANRDDYYAKLVTAVSTALDEAGIDVEILGGATHSIPVDYFADLKALGTLDLLDAVSIHPYTTPPEQFADQIGLLRSVIGNDIAIRVTEFGSNFASLDDAPAYLAKMLSVMGATGIESASWYALARQAYFPNMELWNTPADSATPAGEAFRFLGGLLDPADTIARVKTDDFTHFYTFGEHAAVLWGSMGSVTLGAGIAAYTLEGERIDDFDGRISADTPIVLKSAGTIGVDSVVFHEGTLVADSFDQFDVTNSDNAGTGFEGPWSYFSRSGTGQTLALQTMGGGLKGGELWTPYLGSQWLRPLQIDATTVTPADFAAGTNPASRYAVVERYTAPADGVFTIRGSYDVGDQTRDGVQLTVTVNDRQVLQQHIYDPSNGHLYEFDLQHVHLSAGDRVEFVVSSGANATGDATARHIQIFSEPVVASVPAVSAALDYSAAKSGVQLDLLKGTVNVDGVKLNVGGTLAATGSAHDDLLSGDGLANRFDGGDGDDRLLGLAGDDLLIGGKGADRLDGGEGADRMEGGDGDDVYYVDSIHDLVIEHGSQGGIDSVRSSVDHALGDNVERLYLTGSDDLDAWGNALANILYGNEGSNVLAGGRGADKLYGGGGADTFVFDCLESGGDADRIMDFVHGTDRIAIDRQAFGALADQPSGVLDSLASGRSAGSPDQYLFYDPFVGTLYYDADGSGAQGAVAIVSLQGKPMIDAADILFI